MFNRILLELELFPTKHGGYREAYFEKEPLEGVWTTCVHILVCLWGIDTNWNLPIPCVPGCTW